MATTKKSKKVAEPDLSVYDNERLVSNHDKKQGANKPGGSWPKITQGSHLTVKTFEDGRTELIWDDDALLAEVKAAILKAESTIPVEATPKKTRTKKNGNS